ncbi:MAG: twin transmembrane helix small protein [Alphaproteobacteria bacterium]
MNELLPFLVVAFAIATLGVLAVGIVSMIRGGDFNRRHGNKLMQWRVLLQGGAILLLGILMFVVGR